jgi:hypothetical protein
MMLTETDPRVRAHINLFAVLGALSVLADRSEEAKAILATVSKPTAVVVKVRGLPEGAYTFAAHGVVPRVSEGARRATLLFTSPAHFNTMIDGKSQPIPIAGPAGLKFLTGPFSALADLLATYLKPSTKALTDPEFATTSTILTLHVAAAAIAQVANEDRAGQFSAASIPDGDIALEVGDQIDLRLHALDHRLVFDSSTPTAPARAALRFADLDTAGDILAGRASALGSICDGTLGMRGFIPMIDNTSRILDRVGHYLGEDS